MSPFRPDRTNKLVVQFAPHRFSFSQSQSWRFLDTDASMVSDLFRGHYWRSVRHLTPLWRNSRSRRCTSRTARFAD